MNSPPVGGSIPKTAYLVGRQGGETAFYYNSAFNLQAGLWILTFCNPERVILFQPGATPPVKNNSTKKHQLQNQIW
jgi:hypothetical protein